MLSMIVRNDGRMVVKRERLENFVAGAHPAHLVRVKQAA
jgi:hypothetical protein